MKSAIVCISIHHGNTEKIARSLSDVLNADILRPNEVDEEKLDEYALIGFGSGIYYLKHHSSILNLVDKLPKMNKKCFIFSTRGFGSVNFYHKKLRKKLESKGFEIIGEFSCKGFDTVGILKIFGGINKGRPNEKDLENAKKFAKDLLKKAKE